MQVMHRTSCVGESRIADAGATSTLSHALRELLLVEKAESRRRYMQVIWPGCVPVCPVYIPGWVM